QRDNVRDAWFDNIRNGLTAFNSNMIDQGGIYTSPFHGFNDPATGVLVWIGVIMTIFSLRKNGFKLADVFVLIGFFSIYLALAFVVNKAVDYTRFMIIMPFMYYFVARGLLSIFYKTCRRRSKKARTCIWACAILCIAVWNLSYYWDCIKLDLEKGEVVGDTGRYIRSHREWQNHTWCICTSELWAPGWYNDYRYVNHGRLEDMVNWLSYFANADRGQRCCALNEKQFEKEGDLPRHNISIFLRRLMLQRYEELIRKRYKKYDVFPITPTGEELVVEVY
ncbi:MAG: hypothetical protein ACRD3W_07790, partial [Terriglobales bacterium]